MSKVKSQLGLAQRAGKLTTGDEIVLKAIRNKQARLVIVAAD
ncbi:ribosomal L7Ae/L30e/S12e/Gadd45 family protein, partial [Paenibacillus sp.]